VSFSHTEWHDGFGEKANGVLVNSGPYDGLSFKEALEAVAGLVEAGFNED
jgi:leucyl-tRNA synthetase